MPPPEPYVVIHGGVHKTATSYIQSILQRNAGHLRKRGVHYVHHRTTRKEFTVPCQLYEYEQIGLGFKTKYTEQELDELTRAYFGKISAGADERIIISDENMAGHCGHCVKNGSLYRWRNRLIAVFARQIPYPVREVHLAIRNYADFFAAAYVEFLRSASGSRVIPDAQMKQQVLSSMPNWGDLILTVQGSFPDARVYLWKHEDFSDLQQDILQNLCGPDIQVGKLASPRMKQKRPSASHRAVQEILAAIQREGGDDGLAQRVRIQQEYPRGEEFPGYDPWTAQERAHLIRLYERDVEKIAATDGVTLMTAEDA